MVLKSQLTNGVGFAKFVTANDGLNGNSSHILWRSECGHSREAFPHCGFYGKEYRAVWVLEIKNLQSNIHCSF
jgi:hypothetical protein